MLNLVVVLQMSDVSDAVVLSQFDKFYKPPPGYKRPIKLTEIVDPEVWESHPGFPNHPKCRFIITVVELLSEYTETPDAKPIKLCVQGSSDALKGRLGHVIESFKKLDQVRTCSQASC